MYYFFIVLAVLLFGFHFATQAAYQKQTGSGLINSLLFSIISSPVGLLLVFILNNFRFEFTPFTLLMSLAVALNGIAFSVFAFKALAYVNLSLFAVFSMLGGMALPFLQGILFFNEALTVAKGVCFLLITAALALTVEKGDKKKGGIFYAGVFIFNGLSGVLSKIYTAAAYEKASAEGFSLLSGLCALFLSILLFLFLYFVKKARPIKPKPLVCGLGAVSGLANRLANLLLLIALAHVHVSIQYPMVTGGTMIVSTLIALFGEKKPSKRELVSVLVAFLGTLALFVIPI